MSVATAACMHAHNFSASIVQWLICWLICIELCCTTAPVYRQQCKASSEAKLPCHLKKKKSGMQCRKLCSTFPRCGATIGTHKMCLQAITPGCSCAASCTFSAACVPFGAGSSGLQLSPAGPSAFLGVWSSQGDQSSATPCSCQGPTA